MSPRQRVLRFLSALALLTTAGLVVAAPGGAPAPRPAESPGGTCYKYKYPDSADCGKLKGTEECKGEPTKSDDKCKPEKGDECACGDDDIDF